MLHCIHGAGNLQRCDLTPAASRYIIFESIDEEDSNNPKIAPGVKSTFESVLLSTLTKKLPSVAIQAFHSNSDFTYLRELAARNIPVLFIDSVERAFTIRKSIDTEKAGTRLAIESKAFPVLDKEEVNKIQIGESGLSLEGRFEILNITQKMLARRWQILQDNAVVDMLDAALFAFIHAATHLGSDSRSDKYGTRNVPLHAKIREIWRKWNEPIKIPDVLWYRRNSRAKQWRSLPG